MDEKKILNAGAAEETVTVRKQKMRKDHTKQKLIVLCILVGILLLVAIFAEYLVPCDPYEQDLSIALQPPSLKHLMGTDAYGRDMTSRVIMGSQTTIFSSLALVLITTVFGTAVGVFCGCHGGKTDTIIMRISDIFLAFPGMVFAIAAAGITGGGVINAVAALAAISWPKFARIARSQVLSLKEFPFLSAARLSGSGTMKLLVKHILPNILGPVLVTATLDIGTMMMEIAGLSFLGLGALPPTPEWGSMMSGGRSMLQTKPWVVIAPGCAIFVSVMLFNLLGDTVRDIMDPRQRN